MNKIWLIMLLASLVTAIIKDPSVAVTAMLEGATDSVNLAMELVAVYGVWLGLFTLLDKTGISDLIAKLLRPLIRRLFKNSSEQAQKVISVNMAANLLGLGNAATPMGIKAIKLLGDEKEKANQNVIMIVISATSLQILPTTVISMRAAHGSSAAADFLLPCIVATVLSTIIGVFAVKILGKVLK